MDKCYGFEGTLEWNMVYFRC